ncbi:MAG: flagellar protein FlaG [Burkholderiaceae bacterium]
MTTIQPASHAPTPPMAPMPAAVVKPAAPTPAPAQPSQARPAASVVVTAPKELSPQQQAAVAAISEKPKLSIDPAAMQKRLDQAIENLNEQLQSSQTNLGFSIDSETDIVVVKVTNKETGELVRQIPAEAVVRLAGKMEDLKGLLLDENL